ncbi:hypothetical protein T552_03292 [Pneumocystis carinii B80]|uniref:Uncharacterized protein n=1 Tax=Pneumocystis carinii (strain B80) TaxID=1408658 RepID=A0A0W4ZCF4_PNEC8|nr:hypothetical protein T552_03292 [Pneumocystis carinii B80]KTW26023.1 hypothetical protein T552_03292 [Pneumocystis carinii B80]
MNILGWIFGGHKTAQEQLRQYRRGLEKAQREIQREEVKLEAQEGRLTREIRKSAQAGEMEVTKIKVKDLLRTRKQIGKFLQIKTQLQAISLRIQTVQTHEQMTQSLKSATRLLTSMNRKIHVPSLMKIVQNFQQENDIMEQREEVIDEAIDDIMEDDEIENKDIINQVLDEIGIDLQQDLNNIPCIMNTVDKGRQKIPQMINGSGNNRYDDFQERIDRLKH